ncbi:hypothetical protein HOY80DRAFT_1039332 [Tuber brumale]|nr:hypothetical protein HOY80DRAFT_1039332 [Tuber brumale]
MDTGKGTGADTGSRHVGLVVNMPSSISGFPMFSNSMKRRTARIGPTGYGPGGGECGRRGGDGRFQDTEIEVGLFARGTYGEDEDN